MASLTIALHNGGHLTIREDSPKGEPLVRLRELMCLETDHAETGPADVTLIAPDGMPEGCRPMRSTSLTDFAASGDWSRMYIAGWKKTPKRAYFYQCYVWQMALIYAGMNAILRGENAVLAHCAVLETDRGAVLLFGESGMGKSTASARWRAYGGKCISDDMALLDFSGSDGVIRVRRMPTWSACREEKNEWNYPADEEIPLAGVLGLGRSESGRDEIVSLSSAQFFAQCYRSIFYWNLFHAKELPDEKQRVLTDRIRGWTDIIAKRFAPRALLTSLEGGNLVKTIEETI